MGHKVLSQGVLDGTCFLYSIMNAYKSLVYPEMDNADFMSLEHKEKWENIIRTCPQTQDLLAGNGFHGYISNIKTPNIMRILDNQFKNTLVTSFDILSNLDFEFDVQNIKVDSIKGTDYTNSVCIISIEKNINTYMGNVIGNHFFCINGVSGNNVHIMCSYTIHVLPNENYTELYDQKYKRYYNNMVLADDINLETVGIGLNGIFRITKHALR